MEFLPALPFILLLLSIALLPLIDKHFWESHYIKVSLTLSIAAVIYLLAVNDSAKIIHSGTEYIMFISLLFALYTISGGINISSTFHFTPFHNTIFLLIGAVVANLFGTTGASMLLIRPFISCNSQRIKPYHIIFFIFIVSNAGGLLTPIGDPPLFIGFIKGIPFFWLLDKVFLKWIIAVGILLLIFYIIDRQHYKKSEIQPNDAKPSILITGKWNLAMICLVTGSLFITTPLFLREVILVAAAMFSYKFTKEDIHKKNFFSFEPIKEVAWLFLGLFITMIPLLDLLNSNSQAVSGKTPGLYYWMTGILSAFLDNAPTYLAFITSVCAAFGFNVNNPQDITELITGHSIFVQAISVAAVFFGAFTYIGNGPNFMVRAIADEQGIDMPHFGEYIYKYSLPILLPIMLLIWFLFFR